MGGEGKKKPKPLLRSRCLACFGLAVWLLSTAGGCMIGSGRTLRLEQGASLPESGAPYRLILYGGIGPDDFETTTVLDREDDRFRIVSYTGDIKVKVREGLTAAEALAEAWRFLRWQNTFRDADIMAIVGPDGHVFGYEVRPLYWLAGPWGDAIDTNYVLGPDDTVTFYVYLQRRFWKNDGDILDGAGGPWIGR